MSPSRRWGDVLAVTGVLILLVICGCARTGDLTPPAARIVPAADTLFGEVRVDNYNWLRERSDPEVIAYLEAENRYTTAVMKPTEKMQRRLFQELKGRIKETDQTVPEKKGDYYYYTRTEEGRQYPIYCRRKGDLQAPEEILVDQNLLAQGKSYCEIGAFRVSPDQRLLAYSVDTTGSENYTIRLRDLVAAAALSEHIDGAYGDVEWANDSRTIFYSTLDQTLRPYRLYRHSLGTSQSQDVLVFEEPDEMFYLGLQKTRSEAFLLVNLESMTTTEVRFLGADHPADSFRVVQPRQHDVEYSVAHHGDDFYIVTNDQAENFKLMKAPVSSPSKDHWQEVIPHRPAVMVEGMDAFENHLVVYEREGGLEKIRIQDLRDDEVHHVDFPEPVYTFWPEANPDYRSPLLRFNYTSLVTPRTVYDYQMDDRTWELKKYYDIPGGYDPTDYRSERIWATAADGTPIPISLVCRRETTLDGRSPLYLYGYGAYGLSTDPGFSANRLSLLDRGFIYAIAHVRGGGEMGRSWYLDGKLLNKMNTFTDFIACAEHLVAAGYASPQRLAISGASAGGLLIGAVTTMRPDLFRVAVAEVPFVDVINTMSDPTIPLTVTEFEEWGDPRQEIYYRYMRRYSPYDNVAARSYPAMLITAGLNDPRVQYWEPAKWTAKLRATKADGNLLLLKTNMGSGHFGQTGRYDYLKEVAFEYSLLFHILGIQD